LRINMIHVNSKVADFYMKNGVPVSHVTEAKTDIVTGNFEAKKEVQGMNKFNRIPKIEADRFHELYENKDWKAIRVMFKKHGIISCSGCTRTPVVKRWADYAVENNLI